MAMELFWHRIEHGEVIEEHPRYQIRRVHKGLIIFFVRVPAYCRHIAAALGGNPLCVLTDAGCYLNEPLYTLVGFDKLQQSEATSDSVS